MKCPNKTNFVLNWGSVIRIMIRDEKKYLKKKKHFFKLRIITQKKNVLILFRYTCFLIYGKPLFWVDVNDSSVASRSLLRCARAKKIENIPRLAMQHHLKLGTG